jgi:hypothetical protein
MKAKRYDGNEAVRILIGMATDRSVCARIASQWTQDGLFASRWENMVGAWCVKHLAKHGVPIGRHIESVFENWAERRDDEKTIRLLEKFLTNLGDEHDRESPLAADYVLDMAGTHFNAVRMRREMELAEMDLEAGHVEEANERLRSLERVELGAGSTVVPSQDFEAWVEAFDTEANRPLVELPGDLGEFVGSEFDRDSFVSFTGAYGRGKSWWMLEIAYQAVRQKRRVMLFEVGDMSRRQVFKRLGQRASRRPRKDMVIKYPISFTDKEEGPIIRERKLKAVDVRTAYKAWKRMDKAGRFRLSVHSSGSVSAVGIASIVQEAERGGWVPDVAIIDYADLLAPPKGIEQRREQIDETWKILRRLSQDMHCLVVTASQGDAASYQQDLIRGKNFSDSRTKNDHITAGFGINVSEADKDKGVMRLNWLKRRDDEFSENWQVAVAGCLAIGCPMILSCK